MRYHVLRKCSVSMEDLAAAIEPTRNLLGHSLPRRLPAEAAAAAAMQVVPPALGRLSRLLVHLCKLGRNPGLTAGHVKALETTTDEACFVFVLIIDCRVSQASSRAALLVRFRNRNIRMPVSLGAMFKPLQPHRGPPCPSQQLAEQLPGALAPTSSATDSSLYRFASVTLPPCCVTCSSPSLVAGQAG